MFQTKRIKVGDKVPVALNGKIEELEVIKTFRFSRKEKVMHLVAHFAYKHLCRMFDSQRVIVKTLEGEKIECRLLRPAI